MSEVDICNAALTKLGSDTILALTDDSNRARTVSGRYTAVRDAELRRHRWKFAIKRTTIAALSAVPDSDYDRQFQLPNDFLRLIPGGDILSIPDMSDYRSRDSALYSIEGRKLLTNLSAPLSIRYIARITDTATFDTAFTEALASRLAYEICKKITGNETEKASCAADYKQAIKEAVTANALEAAPQERGDDTWLIARSR
jgi:hypothetical protein